MSKTMPKLFIITNNDKFFLSHRSPIALAAKKAGYDVTILASATGRQNEITDMGLNYIELPMNTTGMNKWEELKTLRFLKKIYRTEKPDIVHHVGLKPILWGTCAARFAKIPHVVNAISGTGFLFSPEKRNSKASKAVCFLLKMVNKKSDVFIFQNHDDEKEFIKAGIIDSCQTRFIKGSGVDLNRFSYVPEDDKDNKKLKVVFTGRMIKSKGVMEFIQAAVILRQKYYEKVEFLLCGGLDSNPTALQKYELETLCDGKYIKWLGFQSNIYEILKQCHIFVFPSYYMEGLPKSIIDAQSAGLPVITTDWVGCRDTVINGENGFLVPVKDAETLAKKIDLLLEDTELRQRMGKNARYFAEQNFDINLVIKKHLEIYALFFAKY